MHRDGAGQRAPVVIVGAGVGGLALAARLSARGVPVQVLEKEATVGGKMRVVRSGEGDSAVEVDGGPTVLTMRWVFDELFRAVGDDLDRHVTLAPLATLARHAWPDGTRLDLFTDRERSQRAIAAAFGAHEGEAYRRFAEHCASLFEVIREPFLMNPLPGLSSLMSLEGLRQARALASIDATRTLWTAVSGFFRDPRLRMLFGRYATYVGSSPYAAPATLNVIAGVEQAGAWVVRGGMRALAEALLGLARRQGAQVRCGAAVAGIEVAQGRASAVRLTTGERIEASAVVTNGDVAHLGALLGPHAQRAPRPAARSLSALVLTGSFVAEGFDLDHHNVFFSSDYAREFAELTERREVPTDPTIYVCAQDRGPHGQGPRGGAAERLLILVNAPPTGDDPTSFPEHEDAAWQSRILDQLRARGLRLQTRAATLTTPRGFERLFPATGGALYGAASHGLFSAFARPACRTPLAGLYAVGGSAHPGAGVPMVALSARIAETILREDLGAIFPWRPAATPGGTSTGSARVGVTA